MIPTLYVFGGLGLLVAVLLGVMAAIAAWSGDTAPALLYLQGCGLALIGGLLLAGFARNLAYLREIRDALRGPRPTRAEPVPATWPKSAPDDDRREPVLRAPRRDE